MNQPAATTTPGPSVGSRGEVVEKWTTMSFGPAGGIRARIIQHCDKMCDQPTLWMVFWVLCHLHMGPFCLLVGFYFFLGMLLCDISDEFCGILPGGKRGSDVTK